MLFNVSGLVQEGIGATRTYVLDESLGLEGREPERIAGTAQLLRTRAGVLVRAQLHMVEPEVCSRCLKPLEETVRVDFEEEFQMSIDPATGEPTTAVDPDAFLIDSQHMLDLREAVRQYREVSLEMQHLCRPDCRGLCPRCGTDLNLQPCQCESPAADARWTALATLADTLSQGKD